MNSKDPKWWNELEGTLGEMSEDESPTPDPEWWNEMED